MVIVVINGGECSLWCLTVNSIASAFGLCANNDIVPDIKGSSWRNGGKIFIPAVFLLIPWFDQC